MRRAATADKFVLADLDGAETLILLITILDEVLELVDRLVVEAVSHSRVAHARLVLLLLPSQQHLLLLLG